MLCNNPRHTSVVQTHIITDSHNIAICNDTTVNMVQLPPVEPNEANALKLTTSNSQMDVDQVTN